MKPGRRLPVVAAILVCLAFMVEGVGAASADTGAKKPGITESGQQVPASSLAHGTSVPGEWIADPSTNTDQADSLGTGSLAAIIAGVSGGPADIRLPAGEYYVWRTYTVPENIRLKPDMGAILMPYKSVRETAYRWTPSRSGASEYYLEGAAGGNPSISQPSSVYANGAELAAGSVGGLADGQWAWGDNDSLGYSTIYIRLADPADPETKPAGYIEAWYTLTVSGPFSAGLHQCFSPRGTVAGLRESNPVWFGAAGATAASDTAAFQAAMNALDAGGNFIVTPLATGYKLNAIIKGRSNVNIIGCGAAGKVTNADPSAVSDISLFSFFNTTNFTVRNLWLAGSAASKKLAVAHGSGTGLYLYGCSNFSIENNRFDHMLFRGVEIAHSSYGSIGKNTFTNTRNDSANGTDSADIEIYASTGYVNSYLTISENQCLSNTTHGIAVSTVGGTTGDNNNIKVLNNFVRNKTRHGIYFYGSSAGQHDILCEGNTVSASGWLGIYAVGTNFRMNIVNNHVINSCRGVTSFCAANPTQCSLPWAGIGTSSGSPSLIFSRQIKIQGNIVSGTNGYSGIASISSNASDIAGNTVHGDGVTAAGVNYGGVVVRDGSQNRVQGNTVRYSGVEGYGIQLDRATADTTWTGNHVTGNHIHHPRSFGILAQYQAKSLIADNHVNGNENNAANLIYINDLVDSLVRDNFLADGKAAESDILIARTASQGTVTLRGNRFFGSKATGYAISLSAGGTDNVVEENDFTGLTRLGAAHHISDAAVRTSVGRNRHGPAPTCGSFFLSPAATTTIANANVTALSKIHITPTNAAAATLMAGAGSLYISARTPGASFAVTTANGLAAAGTEEFYYTIE